MQDELEDLTYRRVVDGPLVLLGDLSENLLLAPGIEEGLPRLGFYGHDLLHDARPLVEVAYELPVDLVHPDPEILYSVLRARVIHRRGILSGKLSAIRFSAISFSPGKNQETRCKLPFGGLV